MGIFADLVNSTETLISDFGRDVTLRQKSDTTPDVTKPWEVTKTNSDTTIKMAFEPFKMREMDDTIVQIGDVKAFVSTAALTGVVPKQGDFIIDGTQHYRVQRLLHYYPGEDDIAYELHCREC